MTPQDSGATMTGNTLYYGDNLDILRQDIPTGSVDLIYLDAPFNSQRNYNVLFREKSGGRDVIRSKARTMCLGTTRIRRGSIVNRLL